MIIVLIGIALLGGMLSWFLVDGSGHWAAKAAMTVLVVGFAFASWHAFNSYGGWPTRAAVPTGCIYDWGLVEEPNPDTGDSGHIYVWCTPLGVHGGIFDRSVTPYEPRNYAYRYSVSLHKQIDSANNAVRKGLTVIAGHKGTRPGVGRPGKNMKGKHNKGGQQQPGASLQFYQLPPERTTSKQ